MSKELTVKSMFTQDSIKKRFDELLGKKAPGFISSVLQIVQDSKLLAKADPKTVLNAAATAAILDLPINQNLGYAWIIPYENKRTGEVVAQFQLGYKGFIQLALRTNQYAQINATPIFENQFKSWNSVTEQLDGDFHKFGTGEILGYAAYFKLNSGFTKIDYWPMDKVKEHARKYSKTYDKKNKSGKLFFSPWNDSDQFDAMCLKTVLKNTLSKWGIMSIQLETAVMADQSIQRKVGQYDYDDNTPDSIEDIADKKQNQRILNHIKSSNDLDSLVMVSGHTTTDELKEAFESRLKDLIDIQSNKNDLKKFIPFVKENQELEKLYDNKFKSL